MSVIWGILFLAFIILEAVTVGLVSIWFAAGALAAGICSFCGGEIWLQLVLFVGVSAILLALLRPFSKKFLKPKQVKTNIDALIGTTGKVIKTINNENFSGQVMLGAMEWTARSTTGEVIEAGTLVKVDAIEGVKLMVSATKESILAGGK